MNCARCSAELPTDDGFPSSCWFCGRDLCTACWEAHGHCGHPEADALNARGRNVKPENVP